MSTRELTRTAGVARARLAVLAAPAGRGPAVEWLVPPSPSASPDATDDALGAAQAPWDREVPLVDAPGPRQAVADGSPPGRRGWLPSVLRDSLLDPARRGLLVLAVVAVLVALVAGFAAWRSRPAPQQLEPRVALSAPADAAPRPASRPVVAVSGRVRKPGLVVLAPGARVADAVLATGGVLPGTDLGMLNLARRVVDGELIVVGPTPAGGPGPVAGTPGPGTAPGMALDLNTATVAQFDGLPGVGPVLAQRIVDYRTAQGGFRSVQQLREVEGIGDTRFQRLKTLVRV